MSKSVVLALTFCWLERGLSALTFCGNAEDLPSLTLVRLGHRTRHPPTTALLSLPMGPDVRETPLHQPQELILLQGAPEETRRWILTLRAVLAFPARVADFLSTLSTGKVTKGIVPGAAEDRAALSIVVLVAHKAIGVLEVSAAAAVKVLGPLLTHCQVSLRGQAADEALRVFCGRGERRVVREPKAARA